LKGTKIYRRARTAAWREVDGQVVVLSGDSNRVRLLNGVGSFIWKHCEAVSAEELVRIVCDHFEVETEIATKDTNHFLEDLVGRGMIVSEVVV